MFLTVKKIVEWAESRKWNFRYSWDSLVLRNRKEDWYHFIKFHTFKLSEGLLNCKEHCRITRKYEMKFPILLTHSLVPQNRKSDWYYFIKFHSFRLWKMLSTVKNIFKWPESMKWNFRYSWIDNKLMNKTNTNWKWKNIDISWEDSKVNSSTFRRYYFGLQHFESGLFNLVEWWIKDDISFCTKIFICHFSFVPSLQSFHCI